GSGEKAMGEELTLGIQGMTCAACVRRVERALDEVAGVSSASVNLATGKARLEVEPQSLDGRGLLEAVRQAGYEPQPNELRLGLEGMTCASCVQRIQRALAALPGVVEAEVNLATAEARVAYLPGLTGPEAMVEAVAAAGYGAREISDDGEARDRERASREAEIAGLRRSLAF